MGQAGQGQAGQATLMRAEGGGWALGKAQQAQQAQKVEPVEPVRLAVGVEEALGAEAEAEAGAHVRETEGNRGGKKARVVSGRGTKRRSAGGVGGAAAAGAGDGAENEVGAPLAGDESADDGRAGTF